MCFLHNRASWVSPPARCCISRLKGVEELVTLMAWAMPCLSTTPVHLALHLLDGPGICYSSLAGMKGARVLSRASGTSANVPCTHPVPSPLCSPGSPAALLLVPCSLILGELWCLHESDTSQCLCAWKQTIRPQTCMHHLLIC